MADNVLRVWWRVWFSDFSEAIVEGVGGSSFVKTFWGVEDGLGEEEGFCASFSWADNCSA